MTRDSDTSLLDPMAPEPMQQTMAPRRNAAMVALRSLVRSRVAFLAALFIVALVLSAIFAPYLAPHEPHAMSLGHRMLWPVWTDAASDPAYLLGTDGLGRDILSRLLHATRMTLVVAVSSMLLSGLIGILLGLVTGYFGGWLDLLVMRLADLQLAFPSLLIGLIVMALIGSGVFELVFVVALTQWALFAGSSAPKSSRCARWRTPRRPKRWVRGICASSSSTSCPTPRPRSWWWRASRSLSRSSTRRP